MTGSDDTVRNPQERSNSPPAHVLRGGDLLSDRYEIRGFLGRGGMGEVYEARDHELGLDIALKTLVPEEFESVGGLRMLKREVLLARQVSHENVCRLHDLWRDASRGLLFATMELLDGETLNDLIQRVGPMQPDEARPLIEDMALGLDAAHRAGVVHRDFKSGNVMIVPDSRGGGPRAVLTDFGLARPASDRSDTSQHRYIEGTPAYMAPEQLEGHAARPVSDIYALGVVVYEMVTGRLPFEGPDVMSAALRKLDQQPRSPREHAGDLPELWESVILRCLDRDPSSRFRSGREVLAALEGSIGVRETIPSPIGNLPPARDAFIGRDRELMEIDAHLKGGTRLLSLLGMGGSGKTRLALEAARIGQDRWPGGIWFCDLTEATSLDGIASAVATALHVPLGSGDPATSVGQALARRGSCLLVLDNYEQAVAHAPESVGAWMEAAEEAVFMVTSRERLRLEGETEFPVDPLEEAQAVELFLDRARVYRPGFEPDEPSLRDVRRLVRGLEGLPLAIELAAARVRVMTPTQIAQKMSDRFRLLSRAGAADRHAALRTAIDVSWDLLSPWEKSAFAQCSVFEGGFTLEAAEQVVDLAAWPEAPWVVDVLQALLDKNLLRVIAGSSEEPRFSMYVSLQEYASDRLQGDDRKALRARHGHYYASLATPEDLVSVYQAKGRRRRWRLGRELDNLVAACRWAIESEEPTAAINAYKGAEAVLQLQGPFNSMAALCGSVLEMPDLEPIHRLRLLRDMGRACWAAGRMDEARTTFDEAITLAREIDERPIEGVVLGNLGTVYMEQGFSEKAREHYEAALAIIREAGDRSAEGIVLGNLGIIHKEMGRREKSLDLYRQALEIAREAGDRRSEGMYLGNIALLLVDLGRLEEAGRHYEDALAIHRDGGDRRQEGIVVGNLGNLYGELGRTEEMWSSYEKALAIHREVGSRRAEGIVLHICADEHRKAGREDAAWDALRESEAVFREIGEQAWLGKLACTRGKLHLRGGDRAAAEADYEEARSLARDTGTRPDSVLSRYLRELREALDGKVKSADD